MSWSVSYIGKPEKIAEKLEKYVETSGLSGTSKQEFEAALPNLLGILKQNFGNEEQLLSLSASGHGYLVNGEMKNSSCAVKIESIYGVLV